MDQHDERVLRPGTVARLNVNAGFGYVRDASGQDSYIFLLGRALKWARVKELKVGTAVLFRTSGQGRVDELVPGRSTVAPD
jgi:cold shock CspA family protein